MVVLFFFLSLFCSVWVFIVPLERLYCIWVLNYNPTPLNLDLGRFGCQVNSTQFPASVPFFLLDKVNIYINIDEIVQVQKYNRGRDDLLA